MVKKWLDAGTSKAIQCWLQSKLTDIAEVKDIQLDSCSARCSITLLLHGEAEEIVFSVTQYEVRKADAQSYVRVNGVTCSRPWMEKLATSFLLNKEFATPALLAKVL